VTPDAEPAQRDRATAATDADLLEALHAAAFSAVPSDAGGGPPAWAEPWSAAAFAELLGLPIVFGRLRLDDTGAPVGFVLGRVVVDEAEILTLAVRPDRAGRGHGRALVESAMAECRRRGATVLHLEVATGNAPARTLYASLGFGRIGLRRSYYARCGISADALVLRRNL
jgi:ribosomal-protein-alanine N-acetyltransferase